MDIVNWISSLSNGVDPFYIEREKFLKSREAKILYGNLRFYMGYEISDLDNEIVKQKIFDAYNQLVILGLQYVVDPEFARFDIKIKISDELKKICNCDYEIKEQFEKDYMSIFNIDFIF